MLTEGLSLTDIYLHRLLMFWVVIVIVAIDLQSDILETVIIVFSLSSFYFDNELVPFADYEWTSILKADSRSWSKL